VKRTYVILCLLLALGGLAVVAWSHGRLARAEAALAEEAEAAREDASWIAGQIAFQHESVVPRGQTFSDMLFAAGLDAATVQAILTETRGVFDHRRSFRAGHRVRVGRSTLGEVREILYQIDADRELRIAPGEGRFRAEVQEIPSITETVPVAGEVRSSLYMAVLDAGERPELAMQIANIFGWDLDFNIDTRPGDTFRLVVERKRYLTGGAVRYGRVLAAEYNNRGRSFQAVLFREPNGREAYYTPAGDSLQKAMLRSPLKFNARITSRFSHSRFHPILRRHRPHLGIDYAAPTGTPVQTVGNGTVAFAGWSGGSGRMVRIRHARGYETEYLHLSAILVRQGQAVQQGQIIGRVGSTGLSTAPHLDFRIRHHGKYRNFLALQLPPSEPVAKKDREEFYAVRDQRMAMLPDMDTILARGSAPSDAAGTDSVAGTD
jgi:murein DD-endopeptidase MepM/ murein hydrolase activator NlpD